jgi:hypothetical protein
MIDIITNILVAYVCMLVGWLGCICYYLLVIKYRKEKLLFAIDSFSKGKFIKSKFN